MKKASTYVAGLVKVDLTVVEGRISFDVKPAALQTKSKHLCNVPSGRWFSAWFKKASTRPNSAVAINIAVLEGRRAGVGDVEPATLHANICKRQAQT